MTRSKCTIWSVIPRTTATLQRLRGALDDWRRSYGDKGEIPETEMVNQMWPDGLQPQTEAPFMVPINAERPGMEISKGGEYKAPLLLQLSCGTQGASVGYKLGDEKNWRLYGGPLHLPVGETRVTAKAIRIGYKESAEVMAQFVVKDE